MKRASLLLTALLLFLLVALTRLSPHLTRWLRWPTPAVAPVATPGAARVEGPYFSDGDRIAERIIAAINHSQKSIHLSMYDLTQPEIAASLEAAHRRGVEIRIVADERQAREPHAVVPYLASRGIPVPLSRGHRGNRSVIHNKFADFDGRIVDTGTFNGSTSAHRH